MAARTWQESGNYAAMDKWLASPINGFYELTVICEGALSIGEYILSAGDLQARILDVAKDAATDGLETEVYFFWHEHAPDLEDCSCSQYLTDHSPAYQFPADLCHFVTS